MSYYNLLQDYYDQQKQLKKQKRYREADAMLGIINRLKKRMKCIK